MNSYSWKEFKHDFRFFWEMFLDLFEMMHPKDFFDILSCLNIIGKILAFPFVASAWAIIVLCLMAIQSVLVMLMLMVPFIYPLAAILTPPMAFVGKLLTKKGCQ